MERVHAIARLGFRKWYERGLIAGHAWLVAALLCAIYVGLSLEGMTLRGHALVRLGDALSAFVGGVFVVHALRRFVAIVSEAHRLSRQAICPACKTYASFDVVNPMPRMGVRCRQCGHEWIIDTSASR
ncbi:MAG: hypothetical protein ACREUX_19550 [Burkholderiales bacterium]